MEKYNKNMMLLPLFDAKFYCTYRIPDKVINIYDVLHLVIDFIMLVILPRSCWFLKREMTHRILVALLHNTLLNVYAKCDTKVDARKVFNQMPEWNVCSWTVMIVACTRDGLPEEALTLFHWMSRIGLQPNHFTFSTFLPACANSASLWKGMEIHTKIISMIH